MAPGCRVTVGAEVECTVLCYTRAGRAGTATASVRAGFGSTAVRGFAGPCAQVQSIVQFIRRPVRRSVRVGTRREGIRIEAGRWRRGGRRCRVRFGRVGRRIAGKGVSERRRLARCRCGGADLRGDRAEDAVEGGWVYRLGLDGESLRKRRVRRAGGVRSALGMVVGPGRCYRRQGGAAVIGVPWRDVGGPADRCRSGSGGCLWQGGLAVPWCRTGRLMPAVRPADGDVGRRVIRVRLSVSRWSTGDEAVWARSPYGAEIAGVTCARA